MKRVGCWGMAGIIALTGVLSVGLTSAWLCYKTRGTHADPKECPAVVAFADPDTGPETISLYDRERGVREVARACKDMGQFDLMGYDPGLRAFLSNTSADVAIIDGERDNRITLRGVRKDAVPNTIYRNGNLYVPRVENGTLMVACYDMAGRQIRTQRYCIPGDEIVGFSYIRDVDISAGGWVAATLSTRKSPNSGLYIFDDSGRFVHRIVRGLEPRFDPKGERLAFNCGQIRTGEDNGFGRDASECIAVYDFATRTLRNIPTRPDRPWWECNLSIAGWTPDGQWIILSGRTDAYALDLRRTSVRYCKLPVRFKPYFTYPDWDVVVLSQSPKLPSKQEAKHD